VRCPLRHAASALTNNFVKYSFQVSKLQFANLWLEKNAENKSNQAIRNWSQSYDRELQRQRCKKLQPHE
jgi:hypothetical protein